MGQGSRRISYSFASQKLTKALAVSHPLTQSQQARMGSEILVVNFSNHCHIYKSSGLLVLRAARVSSIGCQSYVHLFRVLLCNVLSRVVMLSVCTDNTI